MGSPPQTMEKKPFSDFSDGDLSENTSSEASTTSSTFSSSGSVSTLPSLGEDEESKNFASNAPAKKDRAKKPSIPRPPPVDTKLSDRSDGVEVSPTTSSPRSKQFSPTSHPNAYSGGPGKDKKKKRGSQSSPTAAYHPFQQQEMTPTTELVADIASIGLQSPNFGRPFPTWMAQPPSPWIKLGWGLDGQTSPWTSSGIDPSTDPIRTSPRGFVNSFSGQKTPAPPSHTQSNREKGLSQREQVLQEREQVMLLREQELMRREQELGREKTSPPIAPEVPNMGFFQGPFGGLDNTSNFQAPPPIGQQPFSDMFQQLSMSGNVTRQQPSAMGPLPSDFVRQQPAMNGGIMPGMEHLQQKQHQQHQQHQHQQQQHQQRRMMMQAPSMVGWQQNSLAEQQHQQQQVQHQQHVMGGQPKNPFATFGSIVNEPTDLGVPPGVNYPNFLRGPNNEYSPGAPPGPVPQGEGGPGICRFFQNGNCSRGDRCTFSHIPRNPNQTRSRAKGDRMSKRKAGRDEKKQEVKYSSLEQVYGKIYSISKDQHGCRFLQRKLEEDNPDCTEAIFVEVYDHIIDLMTDPFGNYLCQKLLEFCTQDQRLMIIRKMAPEIVALSLNIHGTRVVQRLIEFLSTPEQVELVIHALRDSVVPLIKDLNGNHVVQRCLNKLSSQNKQFIYDAIVGHCVDVATHRHGCCVLQRCIDFATDDQRQQLVDEITVNALTLVHDPFGNYVVQYILELENPKITREVVDRFSGHFADLSVQKFSSNVIEKCLQLTAPDQCELLIQELAAPDRIHRLIQDPYANYVVQRALTVAPEGALQVLVDAVKPFLPSIRNTPYGKRILNRVQKRLPHEVFDFADESTNAQSPAL